MEKVLSKEEMRSIAPAVFTTEAIPHRTTNAYHHVSTEKIIDDMESIGMLPVQVKQDRVQEKNAHLANYARHTVKFTHADMVGRNDIEYRPYVMLINSHDGHSAFRFFGGVYRMICTNGMVIGSDLFRFSIRHDDYRIEILDNGIREIAERMPMVHGQIEDMQRRTMTDEEQVQLASFAARLRLADASEDVSVDYAEILKPRRGADDGTSLWKTYNRVQENCTRGGMKMRRILPDGTIKERASRGITAIEADTAFNQALWNRAVQFVA